MLYEVITSTTIDEMSADGRLQAYAKQVSDSLISIGQSAKDFVLSIGGSFDGVISGMNVTMQSLRVVFNLFTGLTKLAASGLLHLLSTFQIVMTGLGKIAEALGMNGLAKEIKFAAGLMKAEMSYNFV